MAGIKATARPSLSLQLPTPVETPGSARNRAKCTAGEPGAVFKRTASTTQYFAAYSSSFDGIVVFDDEPLPKLAKTSWRGFRHTHSCLLSRYFLQALTESNALAGMSSVAMLASLARMAERACVRSLCSIR